MKRLFFLMVVFMASLLIFSPANALKELPLSIEKVKINGNLVEETENFYVEEGETLAIEVKLVYPADENEAVQVVEDLTVEAEIKGYEYADYEPLEDTTAIFDLEEGDTRWLDLSLKLPYKLDKDTYLLRIRVADKNSKELIVTRTLKVNPVRHGLEIKDVLFSPGTTIKAGYSLLAKVLINNFGGKDEADVKVTLEIPDLGIGVSDYIEEITANDKKKSEELFLKLPVCTKEGLYPVKVTLTYDEGYETVTQNFQLQVLANEKCKTEKEKLILTVGPETQKIGVNQQAVYPLALTNAGTTTKTYLLELTVGDWGSGSLSDNLIVLEPGKTKVAYVYLTAKEGITPGEKIATLTVSSEDDVLKTLYLKADVVINQEKKEGFNLRDTLEIALLVLVVVLVIIGLIVGFSRLKKDKEETEEEGEEEKTYY